MHILIVANGFPPHGLGGVEIYTADLARSLRDTGHQVTVFYRRSDPSGPDFQVTEADDHGIRLIGITNDRKLARDFSETFSSPEIDGIYERYLREIKPDFVHFNHLVGLSANLPVITARYQLPFIIFLHDYWPICSRVRLVNWQARWCPGPQMGGDCRVCMQGSGAIRRWVSSHAPQWYRHGLRKPNDSTFIPSGRRYHFTGTVFQDRYTLFRDALLQARILLVPSEYLRRMYMLNGYPGEHLKVLPLGISRPQDIEQHKRRLAGPINFGFIGSLMQNKGVHVLLEAFRHVSSEHIRLFVYGGEMAPRSYATRIREMAEGDQRIQFLGTFNPSQREQIYAQIDALVVPSIFPETYSLVAREALVRSIPVVASSIGALPEIVVHGVNGFLFPPGDIPTLENLISRIAGDPTRINDLSCPGPLHISSVAEHLELIQDIYHAHSRDTIAATGFPAR